MCELSATVDERIAAIVEYAIHRFYTERDKKAMVIELARDLEGLIPTDTICTEITNRLKDYLKPRTIRDYLDEKYKNRSRVKNARKQKDTRSKNLSRAPPNQSYESSGNGQDTATQFVKKDSDNDITSLFPQKTSKLPPKQDKASRYKGKDSKVIEGLYEENSFFRKLLKNLIILLLLTV